MAIWQSSVNPIPKPGSPRIAETIAAPTVACEAKRGVDRVEKQRRSNPGQRFAAVNKPEQRAVNQFDALIHAGSASPADSPKFEQMLYEWLS
jgi:hypothetical protein